jgi:hypothetical protein
VLVLNQSKTAKSEAKRKNMKRNWGSETKNVKQNYAKKHT